MTEIDGAEITTSCPPWCSSGHEPDAWHNATLWRRERWGGRAEVLRITKPAANSEHANAAAAIFLQFSRDEDGMPRGMTLPVRDARALAGALVQAADLAEANAARLCSSCWNVADDDVTACFECTIDAGRSAQPRLTLVAPAGGAS